MEGMYFVVRALQPLGKEGMEYGMVLRASEVVEHRTCDDQVPVAVDPLHHLLRHRPDGAAVDDHPLLASSIPEDAETVRLTGIGRQPSSPSRSVLP